MSWIPFPSALLAILDKYHVPIESTFRLFLLFGVLLVLPWHPAWRIQQMLIKLDLDASEIAVMETYLRLGLCPDPGPDQIGNVNRGDTTTRSRRSSPS